MPYENEETRAVQSEWKGRNVIVLIMSQLYGLKIDRSFRFKKKKKIQQIYYSTNERYYFNN